jgi:hypothetical protein
MLAVEADTGARRTRPLQKLGGTGHVALDADSCS